MTFGSLFSGIGGFDLGLERAGMSCSWQVEIDPFCLKVLAKHRPAVRRHDDVKTFPPEGDWSVDLICGGFPCQPVSCAGKRKGEQDERWLWDEMCRVCDVLKPRWILAENVPGLMSAGDIRGELFGKVLRDLASIGYDAEWEVLPAAAFGAPHIRDRVFILAYPGSKRNDWGSSQCGRSEETRAFDQPVGSNQYSDDVADPNNQSRGQLRQGESETSGVCEDVANTSELFSNDRNNNERCCGESERAASESGNRYCDSGTIVRRWSTEPNVGRVAHGIPSRVDRLRGLGNAIVPQVAEWIGQQILDFEREVDDRFRTNRKGR